MNQMHNRSQKIEFEGALDTGSGGTIGEGK
jgi:hypothetical protein